MTSAGTRNTSGANILALSILRMKEAFQRLDSPASEMRFSVNEFKTKYMDQIRKAAFIRKNIRSNEYNLKQVNQLVYLGARRMETKSIKTKGGLL